MTEEIKQLLIDCENFIQPYDDGGNEAERLMIRLDEALKQREKLPIHDVNNCPNLTNLWNEAVIKQENGDHNIFSTNDCWGALRTLEKHGLCKINNY